MRTIKIKIKHILLIISVFVLIVSFGDKVFWQGVSIYNRFAPDEYEIETGAMSGNSIKSENERLKVILSDHDYRLYNLLNISDGGTMSGAYIRRESAEKVMAQFQAFGGEELYESNPDYTLNVALVQWFSGDMDQTLKILEAMKPESLDSDDYNHYQMIRLGVALTVHDIDQVLEVLELIDDEGFEPLKNQVKMFLAVNFGIDVDYVEESVFTIELEKNTYYGYFEQIVEINDWMINDYSQGEIIEIDQSLSGKVLINGKPFNGAFIYEDVSRGMSTLDGFDYRNFPVDGQGEFFIEKIDARTMSLGVMVPWQLIHDKQYNREWDVEEDTEEIIIAFDDCVRFTSMKLIGDKVHYEIEDVLASDDRSYHVVIQFVNPDYDSNGSYISSVEPLTELKGTIDLEDLIRGTYPSYMNISGDVTYERIIEPLYYTDDYYFRLSISDDSKDGYVSNGIFSDSNGYVFSYEGVNEIVEGDQLIKEGKVEEALQWYENNLDMHSLKVLVALYSRGYIPVEEVDFQPWLLGGADAGKAAAYLKKLIDDYGATDNDLLRLYRLYTEEMDHEQALEPLEMLSTDNEYHQFLIGENKIMRGHFTEGINYLLAVDDLEYDRYIHYLFVSNRIEDLPEEFYELYIDMDTGEYETLFSFIKDNQYDQGWLWLQEHEDSDLKNFLKLMMLESFETELIDYKPFIEGKTNEWGSSYDFIDFFVDETNDLFSSDLRRILKLLKEENNWFPR